MSRTQFFIEFFCKSFHGRIDELKCIRSRKVGQSYEEWGVGEVIIIRINNLIHPIIIVREITQVIDEYNN